MVGIMIVSEFIEWLKTQDQGATVQVIKRVPAISWEGDSISVVNFNVEQYADYTDMRGNKFAIGKTYENSRTLLLGES